MRAGVQSTRLEQLMTEEWRADVGVGLGLPTSYVVWECYK